MTRAAAAPVGTLLTALLAGCASTGDDAPGPASRELGSTGQLVDGYIGQQMTDDDRNRVRRALEETGDNRSSTWQGGQGRVSYKVTPVRTFAGAGGSRCRDFDTQASIDGRHQKIRGTACRQPDGSWRPLTD
jgi:surface antigen